MPDLVKLKAQFDALGSEKSDVEAVWDEIEKYVMPVSGRVSEQSGATPDQRTSLDLWDLTAPLACEHLASSLHGSVTSPAARWLDTEWPDQDAEQDHDCVVYREALANLAWGELQSSDFNMEIASAYHEYSGLGNMALLTEAASATEWKGLDFTAVPVREVRYAEDSRGGVRLFFRHLRWTLVQCLDRFGEEGLTDKLRERLKLPDSASTRVDIVFAIYRREDVPESAADGGPLAKERRPWGAVYFLLETAEQLGEEDGYYEMPAVVGRWARKPGSAWGFGRGHVALRAVKFLNRYLEEARASAALANNPPTLTTQRGMLTDLHLEPGGNTVVENIEDVKALESHARFDVSAEVIQDARAEIRRCFHEDDLQLKESPAMTATEVQARRDLMDRVLGSPVGRLQADVLEPIVQIVLGHLSRAGRLPPMPDLAKRKHLSPRLKLRGPIARAQLMDEVTGIEREASFVAGLLKMGFEEARYHFDVGAAIREHSKRVGAPAVTMRAEADAKRLMAADQAAARAAQQAATAKDQGAAAQDQRNKKDGAAPAASPPPPPAAMPGKPQP